MPPRPSKLQLKQELVRILEAELQVLERAHQASREGATHEEAKPENDKDTRALEQSYLARGQARRVDELQSQVALVRTLPTHDLDADAPVAIGALVTVEQGDDTNVYLLAPQGGGTRLAAGQVQVVTPRSPIGHALLGLREGDSCQVQVAGGMRELSLVEVR